jgi:hypothetical protein
MQSVPRGFWSQREVKGNGALGSIGYRGRASQWLAVQPNQQHLHNLLTFELDLIIKEKMMNFMPFDAVIM